MIDADFNAICYVAEGDNRTRRIEETR